MVCIVNHMNLVFPPTLCLFLSGFPTKNSHACYKLFPSSAWFGRTNDIWWRKENLSRYTPWESGGGGGGRQFDTYSFLTSALERGEWSASRPGRALPRGERAPGTHCTGGWVGPRAGLDAETGRRKSFGPAGDQTPAVQSVVGQYSE
jgi:hypothetical protein